MSKNYIRNSLKPQMIGLKWFQANNYYKSSGNNIKFPKMRCEQPTQTNKTALCSPFRVFKWVSYLSWEQGGKIAEANLWDHFGMHYYMLWWRRNVNNTFKSAFYKKTGPPYCSTSAAFECSHLRVGKLLGYVIYRGFVVRTQHFRKLETCRIDVAFVSKGFNVYFMWNLAYQFKR